MGDTRLNIAGFEMDVVGVEGMSGFALMNRVRPYMQGIERACGVYVSEHSDKMQDFEIQITPSVCFADNHPDPELAGKNAPGKLRLLLLLDEWDWPPPLTPPKG